MNFRNRKELTSGPSFEDGQANSVVAGRGWVIGDDAIFTAGHVVFEWNRDRDDPRIVFNNNSIVFDEFNYGQTANSLYLRKVNIEIATETATRPARLNKFIEANLELVAADRVLVSGGGDVDSRDAGLVTFLKSTDLANIASIFSYTNPKITRFGGPSGNAVGTFNDVDRRKSGIVEFSITSKEGDSGSAYIIDLPSEKRGFVAAVQSSNPGNPVTGETSGDAIATYFSHSAWLRINDALSLSQSGDITSKEPTNLIVGSSVSDGAESAFVIGSYRADIILGRDGDDWLDDGDTPNDIAYANDQIFGGAGIDHIRVGAGNNLIHGGDFRAYGGTRIALANDGEDTADFGGSTNGIEIRFPVPDAGNPVSATSGLIDSRYKELLGDDFKSALFVKSRTFKLSSEPAFTNTLVSIEKIKGSEASDILYLDELPTTSLATGGISEIDFAGESASGYPGGDLIVLGPKIATSVNALLSNKQAQTVGSRNADGSTSATSISFKNAESIITTKFDDEIFAAEGGFVIAGAGDDKIHLRAGTFAIGGEGADKFYVKTKYDGALASFDNDVFILDFNPGEDELYVDGVLFDGYQKHTRYGLVAEGLNSDGFMRRVWGQYLVDQSGGIVDLEGNNVPQSTSSFSLQGINLNPQTYQEYIAGGLAYQGGKIRDIAVASLTGSTVIDDFGRVQFIDADVQIADRDELGAENDTIDDGVDVAAGYTLNNFLNLHIGKFWLDDQQALRHTIQGKVETNDGSIYNVNVDDRKGKRATFGAEGDNQSPILRVVSGDDGSGGPRATTIELNGFNADSNEFSIDDWNDKATVDVILSNDLGGFGVNPSPFAAAAFSGEGGGGGPNPNDKFSFIYDGQLKVTLPVDLSGMDFTGDYARLGNFDIVQDSVYAFSNTLGLRAIGVLPEKSESITGADGAGRAKIAGDGNENLEGTEGSDLLVGGAGNNILSAQNSAYGYQQNDVLVGGLGDDQYNIAGIFDKSVIAERLDATEGAGGFDVLYLDFASTTVLVVEGNATDDVRLFLPAFVGEGGEGFAAPNPILTIANQLSSNDDDWIEEIRFSDGVVWTRQHLLDQLVSAEGFGGLLEEAGLDIYSLEDYAFAEPVSNYFTDKLRRDLSYSIVLPDGSPAPDWISIYDDPTTGQAFIVGNPPENYSVELDLQIKASVGSEQATVYFRVTIDPVNDAPVLSSFYDDKFVSAGNFQFAVPASNFTDVEGDVITLSVSLADGSPLPSWLTFDGANLSGQSPAGFEGLLEILVEGSDGDLSTATVFNLIISGSANVAPQLVAPLSNQTFAEDSSIDLVVPETSFADANGDTLTYTATVADGSALPAWLSFNGTTFTGTPPPNFVGSFDIRVTASDSEFSVSDDFTLSFTPVNDAPIVNIVISDVTVTAGQLISFAIPSAAFLDVDGDVLSSYAELSNGSPLPSWLSFDGQSFQGQAPIGADLVLDIRVIALDGNLSANDAFLLTINMPDNQILGTSGDDQITGTSAADYIQSYAGGDFIRPGAGADIIDGGTQSYGDRVIYDTATQGIALSLITGGTAGDASGDVYINIEDISGSNFNDVIEGDNLANLIFGNNGNDVLRGLDGNDDLRGGNGADILYGGAGNDNIFTERNDGAADTIYGDGGNDFLNGGLGDVINGGSGDDQIDLYGSNMQAFGGDGNDRFNVMANNLTNLQIDGGTGWDQFYLSSGRDIRVLSLTGLDEILAFPSSSDVSSITIDGLTLDLSGASFGGTLEIFAGTNSNTSIAGPAVGRYGDQAATLRIYGAGGNDILTASANNDKLFGGLGNDQLLAFAGNDELTGGAGDDILAGGVGSDIAIFSGLSTDYSIATVNGSLTVTDILPNSNGDDGADRISGIETLRFSNANVGITSPIILDLDGNGVKTVSAADSNARYDLDDDGLADDTSWIGNTEGLLFLDRDKDGKVTGAGEFSFIDDVAGARSDLEGLRAFDSNKDGILSSLDARFAEFKVWQDRDGDGAAEDIEILTLTAAGVRSINLTGTAVNGTTQFGEVAVINKGSYTRTDGTKMEFLDAALTYFSSATNLPSLQVQAQVLDRKDSKYRISFAGGAMTMAPKGSNGQIDPRAGALGASNLMTFKNKSYGLLSPIILDLDGDGIEMRSIKRSKAAFDMNGDGIADDTGWTGKGDGFLVIDRNNDGKITHASELSFAAENKDAKSDLEALASLDNNGDRVIDSKDVRFGELKVWVDANGNGVTDAGELKTLAEVGIASISLAGRNLEGTAKVGENVLISTSTFTRSDGTTGSVGNAALAYTPGKEMASALVASLRSTRAGIAGGNLGFGLNLPADVDPFDYFDTQNSDTGNGADDGAKPLSWSRDAGMGIEAISDAEAAALDAQMVGRLPYTPGSVTGDRLLAIIAQDMASFGAQSGDDGSAWRREGAGKPVEFFA